VRASANTATGPIAYHALATCLDETRRPQATGEDVVEPCADGGERRRDRDQGERDREQQRHERELGGDREAERRVDPNAHRDDEDERADDRLSDRDRVRRAQQPDQCDRDGEPATDDDLSGALPRGQRVAPSRKRVGDDRLHLLRRLPQHPRPYRRFRALS
jgi:hypothetical protein